MFFWSLDSYKIFIYSTENARPGNYLRNNLCKTSLFGSEKQRLRIFPFLNFPDVSWVKSPEIGSCREHQEEQGELDYRKFIISVAKAQCRDTKHVVEAIHSDWQIRKYESWEGIPAEKNQQTPQDKSIWGSDFHGVGSGLM